MNNLQPLKWRTQEEKAYAKTIFRSYHVTRDKESKDKFCVYYGSRTGKPASGFATIEDAKKWAEHEHYQSEIQPYVKPDSITDIANWFKAAKPEPTDKDICVQLGCHYEEMSEMCAVLFDDDNAISLTDSGEYLKHSDGAEELLVDDKVELLDALCDQIVTATGVAYMMGFDIEGALKEVIRSNNSKMVKGKFEFDENGKIMKPESYSEPDLTPFVKQGE